MHSFWDSSSFLPSISPFGKENEKDGGREETKWEKAISVLSG